MNQTTASLTMADVVGAIAYERVRRYSGGRDDA